MSVRVRTNLAGISQLLDDPKVKALVTGAARKIAADASSLVPVNTGAAAASYRSTTARREPGRVVATAYTIDRAGHIIERGNATTPTYAPLRRAAERSGLRTKLLPKGSG